jgi:hypothetical protein
LLSTNPAHKETQRRRLALLLPVYSTKTTA